MKVKLKHEENETREKMKNLMVVENLIEELLQTLEIPSDVSNVASIPHPIHARV